VRRALLLLVGACAPAITVPEDIATWRGVSISASCPDEWTRQALEDSPTSAAGLAECARRRFDRLDVPSVESPSLAAALAIALLDEADDVADLYEDAGRDVRRLGWSWRRRGDLYAMLAAKLRAIDVPFEPTPRHHRLSRDAWVARLIDEWSTVGEIDARAASATDAAQMAYTRGH
jgi:hypothetical protein